MNKVGKSHVVPDTLANNAISETEKLRKDVVEGTTPLVFKSSVYAATDVKTQLKQDQHGKCAYCERYFNGDYGAVEHFRPKAGYQIEGDKNLYQPGYYWLAYDWDNLLYSCSECNTSYKRNYFPLADETQRDIAHENIGKEQPLLLNPAKDEIGDYLEFNRHIVVAKDTAPSKEKAEKTIALFQLNDRSVLRDRRKSVWYKHKEWCEVLEMAKKTGNQALVHKIEVLISKLESEEAEFTGMFKYQRI